MNFFTPYIILFLSNASFCYLLGCYAYVNKNIIEIFQTSKTELGLINGIGLGSVLGVIYFLVQSASIKPKIITYYTWNCIGYMLCYALILVTSMIWGHPSKIFLYILIVLIGSFRCVFLPGMMLIIKMHKDIYDQTHSMDENYYKLLTNIWSVGFDVGMVISFFICNWLQYSLNFRWEYLIIIGLLFMLVTTTMVFLGLRSYIQDRQETEENLMIEGQIKESNLSHEVSFVGFFWLIFKDLPCKLFLVNNSTIGPLHVGFCLILPAFFYDSGYKGNEGYLTAIFSLFIVFGTIFIAILDFIIHKLSEKDKETQQHLQLEAGKKIEHEKKSILPYFFTISLFFFTLTLIILTVLSIEVEKMKSNSQMADQSTIAFQIILMCCLGFFLGGPLKVYNFYRSIKTMERLENQHYRLMRDDSNFVIEEQKMKTLALQQNLSFWDKIRTHRIQIGTSLVTFNKILCFVSQFVLLMVSFYLIENYLTLTMGFLALLAVFIFIIDLILTILTEREQRDKEKAKQVKIN